VDFEFKGARSYSRLQNNAGVYKGQAKRKDIKHSPRHPLDFVESGIEQWTTPSGLEPETSASHGDEPESYALPLRHEAN
jgi:hypothetical protein